MFEQVKAKAIAVGALLLGVAFVSLAVGCYSGTAASQTEESPQPQAHSSSVFVGSYDDARKIWPFTLKEPGYLPEGMRLTKIFLDGFGHAQPGSQLEETILEEIKAGERTQGFVSAAYNRPAGDLGLEKELLQISQGFGPGWIDMRGVPKNEQGKVTLDDGHVATWKKGVTYLRGEGTDPSKLEWVPRDQILLFWTEDGKWGYGHLGYEIMGRGSITLEEVVKVANSLR